MSSFELQYTALAGIRSRVQATGGNLADCSARLRSQMSRLSGQYGFGIETVRSNIGAFASNTLTLSRDAYDLAAFLSDLERSVTDNENQAYSILAGTVPEDKRQAEAVVAWSPGGSAVISDKPPIADWLKDLLEDTGPVGGGIAAILKILDASENDGAERVFGVAEALWDFAGNLKDLGKNLVTPSGNVATWWQKALGYTVEAGDDVTKSASRLGAVASGVTIALDGIMNWFDNKDEQAESGGTMSTGRVVAETVMETALAAGATYLVGAAIVALSPISLPVLAIGAGTALVGILANGVTEAITGKSLTELVSDGILDTASNIGSAVKNGFNSAVNCFTNAVGNFTSNWSFSFGF